MSEITLILSRIQQGDPQAADELLSMVYQELRKIAAYKMAGDSTNPTLQPTALVHEAWLRLGGDQQPAWNNRAHFFSAAAEAMRRILIERARRRGRLKHGRGLERIDLETIDLATECSDDQLLAVNEALEKLRAKDPIGAQLVQLRFFVGLPNVEAAKVLGIPERTAKRVWAYSRAWLFEELKKGQ